MALYWLQREDSGKKKIYNLLSSCWQDFLRNMRNLNSTLAKLLFNILSLFLGVEGV